MELHLPKQLEGVDSVVPQEAGNTPEHAEGFYGAGGFGFSHIGHFPAELAEDSGSLISGIDARGTGQDSRKPRAE